MPTGARLVAALGLAFLGLIVSGQVILLYPEATDFGWFTTINTALGLLVGWQTLGPRAGRGAAVAITNGITGAVVLLFWALFVQAVNEMVRLAMANRYDGPLEALVAVFEIGVGFFLRIATPGILVTLAIGGVIVSLAAEAAARRWR
ncbi:TrgA family protein [Citreimonas sp.]|uniref:TrgA family protein n=1 Tax=Citreimonas sp. TaxID=3036715 RepID=UPI0035C84898